MFDFMKSCIKKLCTTFVLSLLVILQAYAQKTITVKGTVNDAQTGQPVTGAVVMVKSSNTAALVEMDGKYQLNVPQNAVLVCSCLGYVEQEVNVNNRSVINFELVQDTQMIDETVVVGYGTLKKSQLVGSVESISGEVLEDRVNSNITRSLQGQVAGLNIVQTDGKPTHGGNVYIRGGSNSYISRNASGSSKSKYTIGQGGGALVLIDGVEGELSSVNPEDVESVSVLKDASSSVIYGSRAAYGVILVTTKTGKDEKVNVSYNGSFSVNQRTIRWEDNVISDGLTFVETFYEHWIGNTETPTAPGKLPTAMNTYKITTDYLERYRQRMAEGKGDGYEIVDGKYLYYGNNNYLKMFYKPVNYSTSHNLSVNGSSGKTSYSISGRYYMQDGIYKIGNEDYDAYNMRAKIKTQINNWLSVDNNMALYQMDYIQPMFSKKDGNVGSQLRQIAMIGFAPVPTYNEDGTYTVGAAPSGYASFVEGNSGQKESVMTVNTTTGITIEPIKDVLSIRGEFAYKYKGRNVDRYTSPVIYSTSPGALSDYISQADSYKKEYIYSTKHITANAIVTWTPKLGENHNLNVVGGWNLENYNYKSRVTLRQGMIYPAKPNFELMDGAEVELTQGGTSYGLIGYFARVNYSLLRRYIFEVSARYDGSSKFPINQQWGFFPSASLGWRISEEPWMKSTRSWLENLKLRANAGSLGNGTVAAYAFLTTMGMDRTSTVFDGSFVNMVGDPNVVPDNLSWEKVATYDVGLDADFLRNRLSFSADYYIRNTTDLYISGPEIPATFGSSTPKGNYGALQTKGWELTLSWRDAFKLAGKEFTYSIKGSVWDSRTWVTQYYNESGNIFNFYSGKELGEIWGFQTEGFFMSNEEAAAWPKDEYHKFAPTAAPFAGDLKFSDLNGDNVINTGSWTLEDHGDLKRIGNEAPRYQFGLNLDFRWNGIGLSAFFQGVGKRDWYPAQATDFFWGAYARAYCGYVLKDQAGDNHVQLDKSTENWTVTNADKNPYWPRRTYASAESMNGALVFPSTHFLQNAAYVRLKNLTIDYSLPKKVLEKIKVQKLRFYVTGENLLTWSPLFKHTTMFDPEVIGNGDSDFHGGTGSTMGDGYSYPMLRSFTFGINLTF